MLSFKGVRARGLHAMAVCSGLKVSVAQMLPRRSMRFVAAALVHDPTLQMTAPRRLQMTRTRTVLSCPQYGRSDLLARVRGCKLSSMSEVSSPRPMDQVSVAHVLGGMVTFFIFDYVADTIMRQAGLLIPSSITCIISLGLAASNPRIGRHLQRALGPGGAWLRAGLPIFLIPPIMVPLVLDLPPVDTLAKIGALAAASLAFTLALNGHLASKLLPTSGKLATVVDGPSLHAANTAARTLSSGRFAALAVVVGTFMSAAIALHTDNNQTAVARAPAYVGLTIGAYVAGSWLPAIVKLILPPTIFAGLSMAALASVIGGSTQVSIWLDGAGAVLLAPVAPAMGSLGLFAHTHRPLLTTFGSRLILLVALTAPAGLLFSALLGSKLLGLPPEEVGGILPATTTTGLALAMGEIMGSNARQEWIPLGPMVPLSAGCLFVVLMQLHLSYCRFTPPQVCGMSALLLWRPYLALTGLTNKTPFVKGFALGTVSHVSVMAALSAAAEAEAAEAAALGFFLVGTTRCLILMTPPLNTIVQQAMGAQEGSKTNGRDHMIDKAIARAEDEM